MRKKCATAKVPNLRFSPKKKIATLKKSEMTILALWPSHIFFGSESKRLTVVPTVSMFLQCCVMLFGRIAFVPFKAIRVPCNFVQMRHKVVSEHFRNVRGRRNGLAFGIALDHADLLEPQVRNCLIAIDQYHWVFQLILVDHPLDRLSHGVEGCL